MPRVKGEPYRAQLEGLKFNRLTVKQRMCGAIWECVCDCGNVLGVSTYQLKSGKTKSCGCWSRDRTKKHGMEGTAIYNAWAAMIQRCTNPKNRFFHAYGARGITICNEWLDFKNFYADMGDKPEGMSLDRINNDGNYEPSNCKWSTQKEQIRNRRVSPKYEYQGQLKSLAEWCELYNLPWRRIYERMRLGWTIEKALTEPIGKTGKKHNEH